MLHEKIVRMTVSVRPCDGDAFTGGAVHESQFGEFASEFLIFDGIKAMLFQGSSP